MAGGQGWRAWCAVRRDSGTEAVTDLDLYPQSDGKPLK